MKLRNNFVSGDRFLKFIAIQKNIILLERKVLA